MGEVFDLLAVQHVIPARLGNEMRRTVTVRNIIIRDYARLDHTKAHDLIVRSLKFVPKFCLTVLKAKGGSRDCGQPSNLLG